MDIMMKGKRVIAGFMVMVTACAFTLSGARSNAAEKEAVKYIKDFKLYIAKNSKGIGTYDEEKEAQKARDWFESKDYTMIEGNLNADASGALKKEVGVYLGYSTTTDKKEAVTDIAVMNERGNYSQSEYKRILEEQKKMYTDMVSDMKTMLEEYRKNVNNNVPTAIQARDFMNGYIDNDSNEKLGDLLMTIDDEKLSSLLMQANGQIVLMIQERLSYACDNAQSTWLDRMVRLGSYDKLEKQALKACNNDITKARHAMDKKYKEDALILSTNWEDVRQHIINIREKIKAYGFADKSKAEIESFFEENKDNTEIQVFMGEYLVLSALERYPYEKSNLACFFDQSVEEFKGDGIRKLYPLAASLSDGQVSAVDQSVSIFTLVLDALNAGVYNGYESGQTKELMDKADDTSKTELTDTKEEVDQGIKNFEETTPMSIYAGVDREIFKDGIAVTPAAQNFSNGDGTTWADVLVNSWVAKGVAIAGVVGSVACFIGAAKAAKMIIAVKESAKSIVPDYFNAAIDGFSEKYAGYIKYDMTTMSMVKEGEDEAGSVLITLHRPYDQQPYDVQEAFRKKALGSNEAKEAIEGINNKASFYKHLEIGLAVVGVLLAAADIVMTSITLIKYYNREHLPIPGYMVDLTYNDDEQTSFVNYKSVTDQNSNEGDLNGDGGKQWLALYQTHDEDAGDPILAPENGSSFKVVVQYGSGNAPEESGYEPLHMFGTPNFAQNLTFADGESGWSYNDGKNGTYLFFRRATDDNIAAIDSTSVAEEDKTSEATDEKTETDTTDEADTVAVSGSAVSGTTKDAGTALGGGWIALIGAGCGCAGIVIGIVSANLLRRRKENDLQ